MTSRTTLPGESTTTQTRLAALLFVIPGLVGVLAPLAPHPGHYDVTLLYGPSVTSIVIGVLVWAFRRVLPQALYLPLLCAGLCFDGLGLVAAHATATMALVMLPAVLWGAYYLTRRRELLISLGVMCLSYAVALRVDRPAGIDPSSQWLFTMIYLTLAACVTHAASRRLNALLRESREASLVDALTGLANRRSLIDDLASLPHDQPHVVVLWDLNGFKAYNDRWGHLAGDELLRDLGRRFAEAIADAGRAYRLGGDEFCAILRGNENEAHPTLTAATRALSLAGTDHRIDAAWGAAVLPDEGATASDILRLADERMYLCKDLQRKAGSTPRAAA